MNYWLVKYFTLAIWSLVFDGTTAWSQAFSSGWWQTQPLVYTRLRCSALLFLSHCFTSSSLVPQFRVSYNRFKDAWHCPPCPAGWNGGRSWGPHWPCSQSYWPVAHFPRGLLYLTWYGATQFAALSVDSRTSRAAPVAQQAFYYSVYSFSEKYFHLNLHYNPE